MKIILSLFLFFGGLSSAGYYYFIQAPSQAVPDLRIQKTSKSPDAFQGGQVLKDVTQASPEFEKAAYVLEQFKETDVEVLFNGKYLKPKLAYLQAKAFLGRNFKEGETAADWVKRNCYRTTANNIIYFKYADGNLRPMRDVFLEMLERLPA